MILKKGHWLFVSTMKCATNTLYEALQSEEVGGKWAGGDNFHGIPSHPLPLRLKFPNTKNPGSKRIRLAPLHFTACRNPYSRAVSIWASVCMREDNQEKYEPYSYIAEHGGAPHKFDDFVRLVLANPLRPQFRVPWLYRNQTDWQDRFFVDAVVHVEDLEKELFELIGVNLELDTMNSSPHTKWEDYYENATTRTRVRKWAGQDFARFGYAY